MFDLAVQFFSVAVQFESCVLQLSKMPTMQKVVWTLASAIRPITSVILLTGFVFLIFSILGLTLFRGLFYRCDDLYSGDVGNKNECVGIFKFDSDGLTDAGYSLDGADGVVRPRVWQNPKYTFDSIFKSLATLFVVSTLDNWTEILDSGMDITGPHSLSLPALLRSP